MADVESNMVRCPDQDAATKMIDGKDMARKARHLSSLKSAPPLFGAASLNCIHKLKRVTKDVYNAWAI
eukprot:scaffold60226_cov19-Tisochrysis_lutea.AAC.2